MAQPNHRRDPDKIRRVKELHAQGLSRNAIHRELGIPQESVSNIARDAGLTFDRTRTAQATKAKQLDAADRRANLVHRFYDQAEKVMDRLDRPTHKLAQPSAGKLVKWDATDLPGQDLRALIQAAGAAVDKAVRLEQIDARDGADDVASMLGKLGDALLTAADHVDGQAPTESPTEE